MADTARLGAGASERVFVGDSSARFVLDSEPDPVTREPRSLISGGAHGEVHRATWDGVEVAAKTLHMFQHPRMYGLHENPSALVQAVQEFEQEISLIYSLRHENIVAFVGVAYKRFMGADIPAWICTELAVTSLNARIHGPGGVPHDLVRLYTMEAASGLHYMHSHKVLHRDVKPANMVITHIGRLKLCDLGLAKVVDRASKLSNARGGTAVYLPPEPFDHDKKDVFGLGCTLVEMILKEAPEDDGKPGGDHRPDQARRAAEGRADLARLVTGCTAYDHKQRFRAADVLACEDLQDWTASPPASVQPISPSQGRWQRARTLIVSQRQDRISSSPTRVAAVGNAGGAQGSPPFTARSAYFQDRPERGAEASGKCWSGHGLEPFDTKLKACSKCFKVQGHPPDYRVPVRMDGCLRCDYALCRDCMPQRGMADVPAPTGAPTTQAVSAHLVCPAGHTLSWRPSSYECKQCHQKRPGALAACCDRCIYALCDKCAAAPAPAPAPTPTSASPASSPLHGAASTCPSGHPLAHAGWSRSTCGGCKKPKVLQMQDTVAVCYECHKEYCSACEAGFASFQPSGGAAASSSGVPLGGDPGAAAATAGGSSQPSPAPPIPASATPLVGGGGGAGGAAAPAAGSQPSPASPAPASATAPLGGALGDPGGGPSPSPSPPPKAAGLGQDWRGSPVACALAGSPSGVAYGSKHRAHTVAAGAARHQDVTPPRAFTSKTLQAETQAVLFADPRSAGSSHVGVVAFYFPGRDEPCDRLCRAQFLGNFWESWEVPDLVELQPPVARWPQRFRNAEAAFQALKFWPQAAEFARLSGDAAFRLKGRYAGQEDRTYAGYGSNWRGMMAVLESKFQRCPAARDALVRTNDAFLLEHNSVHGRDSVWSNNMVGDGTNWLGMQLMLLRDKLAPADSWTSYLLGRCQINPETGQPISQHGADEWQRAVKRATDAVLAALQPPPALAAAGYGARGGQLTCATPGCRNPPWNGRAGEYCSRTCRDRAAAAAAAAPAAGYATPYPALRPLPAYTPMPMHT